MNTFRLILIIVVSLLLQSFLFSQTKTLGADNNVLLYSEELVYEVSWLGFSLGTVTMSIKIDKDSCYSAVSYIDSYSGVPFANVHSIFKSVMDKNAISKSFTGLDKEKKNVWIITHYLYNDSKTQAYIFNGTTDDPNKNTEKINVTDTLKIDSLTQDGLSLFYFARQRVKSHDTLTVKAIVTEKLGDATLNFYGKETDVKIDAIIYPVSVIEFDGVANFSGIFGLTGEFEGWFSNDDAHIPIKAKVGVILGSVTIELIKWKREGWIPPRYKN